MHSLDFFRRNLKPLMAALTLMAMITFVFDDSMRAGSSFLVPVLFGLLLGGGGFVWGTRTGKQNEYLAIGGVGGVVLGLVLTTIGQLETGDNVKIAGLTRRDIANMKSRRQSANQIVSTLYQKSHPMPKELLERGPFMAQIHQMQTQRAISQLQFGFDRDLDQDVVLGDLLRREAKRLHIVVNDNAVTDFIKMVTDRKLTTEEFSEVREELHLGDFFIYEILREQLEARIAAEMTYPRNSSTPDQRWQDFRKVAVTHQIEATTIPVEAFVKGISEPSDSELLAFFKEHAEKNPGPKGEPGFRQPERVRLAYLEADFEAIEGKITPPTDDEIAKYYEENRELRFLDRTPVKDETKDGEAADKEKTDGEKKEGEKREGDKPDADKPAKPQDTEKSKTDPKEADKPKESDTEKKSDTEKPAVESSEKKSDADKSNEAPKNESEKSNPPGASGDDEVKSEKPAAEKPAAEDKKEEPKSEEKKPDSDAKPKADPQEEKPAEKTDNTKPDSEKPVDKKADSEKSDSDKDELKFDEPTKKPEPRYKPLADVKDEIIEQIVRERTLEEMKKRIESVIGEMRKLGSYTMAPKDDPKRKSAEDVAESMKGLAQKQQLKYFETSPLSAYELFKSEEHKIGSASDAIDAGFNQQGAASVVQRVFGQGSENLYTPEVAHHKETDNRYAYWVIERKVAHVPKFDERGVRDQVVEAWKQTKARPKAEERAKGLAKRSNDDQKSLPEIIAGETVNGDKEGLQLTVIEPPEFAHFKQEGATAPKLNPLTLSSQRIEMSQIAGLENVDDSVLTAIDRLVPGAAAAIPNADLSAYFVIRVKARADVDADAEAPQRKDFLEKWTFAVAADQLSGNASVPLRRNWVNQIEQRYNVIWPLK